MPTDLAHKNSGLTGTSLSEKPHYKPLHIG
jgi:hypothetical protein